MVIRLLEKKQKKQKKLKTKKLKTKKSNATTLKYNYVPGPKSGKKLQRDFFYSN